MIDFVVVALLAAAAGFAFGYGVRHAISRHRHAAAGRLIYRKEHAFRLIGPRDLADRTQFHPHKMPIENRTRTPQLVGAAKIALTLACVLLDRGLNAIFGVAVAAVTAAAVL